MEWIRESCSNRTALRAYADCVMMTDWRIVDAAFGVGAGCCIRVCRLGGLRCTGNVRIRVK
jgi:hypothetical protein